MIIEKRILDFEKLGFGMFVHFGLYSSLGEGEWAQNIHKIPQKEYEKLAETFNVEANYADRLVLAAKNAGCKYITITTRHHDGFSLYDTKGLSDYDAPHSFVKRDLIKEFVTACNKYNVLPMFYHTTLDWRMKSFKNDFKAYLKYLRDSVEVLCRNYGTIGGFWFDGNWSQSEYDWEEDALYSLIRKYQPDAMIINNTGLEKLGELGNIELDSVTFERGKVSPINFDGARKYVASEMCQILNDHWGYASKDINYKSMKEILSNLVDCRKYGANFLLNVGLMGNGEISLFDSAMLSAMSKWINVFGEAIYNVKPANIQSGDDFILRGQNCDYLFVKDLVTVGNDNVTKENEPVKRLAFNMDKQVKEITWMDNGEKLKFSQNNNNITIRATNFFYGTNYIIRVAKIEY